MPAGKATMTLRLDPELQTRIDERAAKFNLTRTAWITLALNRMVDMPTQVISKPDTKRF